MFWIFFYSREEINQKQKREQKGLPVNSDDESPAEPWARGHAHIVFRKEGWKPWLHQHSTFHMHVKCFYLMISSRIRNQKVIENIHVFICWQKLVMCGLSYWCTPTVVSFVWALDATFFFNPLAFSRSKISKFFKIVILKSYTILNDLFLQLVFCCVFFLSLIKFYS